MQMKQLTLILLFMFFSLASMPAELSHRMIGENYYVNSKGLLCTPDGHNAAFFGVNYTLPFAHGYRAMGYLGIDPKKEIDQDVYHFARLGFNAYRIHLWDVELSDAHGNLLDNEHLDLLDYLIFKLGERGIHSLLTLQTNFGDGYPERNRLTDGFSYHYDKCNVHENPQARKAQRVYVADLMHHVNKYTGRTYASDPLIVGFEINNEPCHSGTPQEVADYIKGMVDTLRTAGTQKPLFYNVSQNPWLDKVFYNSPVQGVTFQWYPVGLVAGHERQGNYLPAVDDYVIPFDTLQSARNKAKIIYEFDAADNLYSFLIPSAVRSFRSAGFQWITQFAYDPIDEAPYNTDYQTHYLNLAYTPNKAIGMMIAAKEVRMLPLGKTYGTYPNDTVFGDFHVSYLRNLAELNTMKSFIYTNNTNTCPVNSKELQHVAGCGSSDVVSYAGNGAYFLDRVQKGIWRLEVMPDVFQLDDPFKKPSLKKQVTAVQGNTRDMRISLPDLGANFSISKIASQPGDTVSISYTAAREKSFAVRPGVYLLTRKNVHLNGVNKDSRIGHFRLGEFVAPADNVPAYAISSEAPAMAYLHRPLKLSAQAVSKYPIDSVVVMTDQISFWKQHNPDWKMTHVKNTPFTYETTLPADVLGGDELKYTISVFTRHGCFTAPAKVDGMPLDWDYISDAYYHVSLQNSCSSISLLTGKDVAAETYTIEGSGKTSGQKSWYLQKSILKIMHAASDEISKYTFLCIDCGKPVSKNDSLRISLVDNRGITWQSGLITCINQGKVLIPVASLKQVPTILLPHAYPDFMKKTYATIPSKQISPVDFEFIQMSAVTSNGVEWNWNFLNGVSLECNQ
jgi:hypothetical protein